LKRGPRQGDLAALGDWVKIEPLNGDEGIVLSVEDRQRALVRQASTPRGEYQQVIIANLDQAVFVFSCAQPAPRLGMLDRFLVIAERQGIPALIAANKVDLIGQGAAEALFGHYPALGYPVIYTSARRGDGLDELERCVQGKITVFSGPSGVGKSSLLNRLSPGLELEAQEVSHATQKGRHTTVAREMYPLAGSGYLADTPGLKALALWDIQPEELDGYFPEMRSRVTGCQFNDCTHVNEPGCAVRQALADGQIHPRRYTSYLYMRAGEEED
jgi:ribosome biogenesis GTPase